MREQPDLERQKNQLIKSLAADEQLKELEDKILKLLSGDGQHPRRRGAHQHALRLEDHLGRHQRGVAEAEETNKQINATRMTYVPAAERGRSSTSPSPTSR